MTIKEKLMKERPELDEDYFRMHCPDEEGLISSKKCMCTPKSRVETLVEAPPKLCKDCWNQKVGPSAWQITLIVFGVLALLIGLVGLGMHVLAAEPPVDDIDILAIDTLEPVKESVTEEPIVDEPCVPVEMPATDAVETKPVVTEVKPTTTIDISKGKPVTLVATAYCPCVKCCGKTDGITATGTKATAGRTIAVDPRMIPYGSKVIINGVTYIAEDCGGAIKSNRIDIFFDTHQEARQWGRKTVEAIIITE